MSEGSNVRQMPPAAVIAEYPDRLGLRVTLVQLAIFADLTPRLVQLGLTSPSRVTALSHIAANPGCTQAELGVYTGLSRASTMNMVLRFVESRLIERRSARDTRTHALYLTDRGQTALDAAFEATGANEEVIFGALDDVEREALKRILGKIIAHVPHADGTTIHRED